MSKYNGAQFIKRVKKTDFLKNIGSSKEDWIQPTTQGGLYDILYLFGEELVEDLARRLSELNKVSSGDLIDKMRFQASIEGNSYTFEFFLPDYYKWVDRGRKPREKMVPFDAINNWAKTKNLELKTNRFNKYGRILKKFKTHSTVSRVEIVDAIRWGIYYKGIKATNYWKDTIKNGRVGRLSQAAEKAIGKDVTIHLIDYVNEIKKEK